MPTSTAGCRLWSGVLAGLLLLVLGSPVVDAQESVRDSEPELFRCDELVHLGQDPQLSPALGEKLRVLTTAPFIHNEAYYVGAKPRPLGS